MKAQLTLKILNSLNEKLIKWYVGNNKSIPYAGCAIVKDNDFCRLIGDTIKFGIDRYDKYYLRVDGVEEHVMYEILEEDKEKVYQWYIKRSQINKQINDRFTNVDLPIKVEVTPKTSTLSDLLFMNQVPILDSFVDEMFSIEAEVDKIEYEFALRVIERFGLEIKEVLSSNEYFRKLESEKAVRKSRPIRNRITKQPSKKAIREAFAEQHMIEKKDWQEKNKEVLKRLDPRGTHLIRK